MNYLKTIPPIFTDFPQFVEPIMDIEKRYNNYSFRFTFNEEIENINVELLNKIKNVSDKIYITDELFSIKYQNNDLIEFDNVMVSVLKILNNEYKDQLFNFRLYDHENRKVTHELTKISTVLKPYQENVFVAPAKQAESEPSAGSSGSSGSSGLE